LGFNSTTKKMVCDKMYEALYRKDYFLASSNCLVRVVILMS
jgi:hypothetical protein